jgi:hypothetical protein
VGNPFPSAVSQFACAAHAWSIAADTCSTWEHALAEFRQQGIGLVSLKGVLAALCSPTGPAFVASVGTDIMDLIDYFDSVRQLPVDNETADEDEQRTAYAHSFSDIFLAAVCQCDSCTILHRQRPERITGRRSCQDNRLRYQGFTCRTLRSVVA